MKNRRRVPNRDSCHKQGVEGTKPRDFAAAPKTKVATSMKTPPQKASSTPTQASATRLGNSPPSTASRTK